VVLSGCGSNLFGSDRDCGRPEVMGMELTVQNATDIRAEGPGTSAIDWSLEVEDVCVAEAAVLSWEFDTVEFPDIEVEAWVLYGVREMTIPTTRTLREEGISYDAVHNLGMKDQFEEYDPGRFTMGLSVSFASRGSRQADSLYLETIVDTGLLDAAYRHPLR